MKVIWDPDLHLIPNLSITCYLNDFVWAPSLFIREGFPHLPLRSLFVRMMYKSTGVSVRVSPIWQDRDLSLPLTASSLHSEAEESRVHSPTHQPVHAYALHTPSLCTVTAQLFTAVCEDVQGSHLLLQGKVLLFNKFKAPALKKQMAST